MIGVNYRLVIHRRVNGGDHTGLDTELIIEHFNHWHHTVGGAGGAGDYGFVAAENMLIDAIDNGGIDSGFSWLGKQHALGATADMLLGGLTIGEGAAAFQYYIDLEFCPGQLLNVRLVNNSDAVAINGHPVLVH